jgi:hypothetical protein
MENTMFKRVQKRSHETASETSSEASRNKSRILARRLARPLTAEEIECVSGGARIIDSPTYQAGTCCQPDIGD